MTAVSKPDMTIQLTPANIVDAFDDRRLLITGQMTTAGSATTGVLLNYEDDLENGDTDKVKELLGTNAEVTNRFLQCLQGTDGYVPIDILPVADAAGTAATGTINFTGSVATEDGSLTVNLVDAFQFSITLDILDTDDATDIGDALVAALAAYPTIPLTAINTTGSVAFTATNLGTVGNFYGIEVQGAVAGVTVVVTGIASGATDPTLTSLFDAIGDIRYTGIGWPEHWEDELSILTALLEARFNPTNAILDGMGFMGRTDSFSANNIAVDALNTQVVCIGGNDTVNATLKKGGAILQPADYAMSYFMGVRAKRLTPDAPISSDIVATSGRLDALGGPSLASLPYFNTPLPFAPVAPADEIYTELEQQELEASGYCVIGTNRAKSGVIAGPFVTPWTNDSAGNPNVSFHYLNYVDTGSVCREIFFNTLKARYSQSRLTQGNLVAGRNMANDRSIKATLLGIYRVLAQLALVQAGSDAEKYFSDNTTVTVDLSQRKATIDGPLAIVTQLGTINYILQFSFTINQTGQQITV